MAGDVTRLGGEIEAERRRRSRRALLIAGAVILGVFLMTGIAPAVWAVRAWSEVRRLDSGFARIERDMPVNEVYAIMRSVEAGDPHSMPHNGAWWIDEPLPASETAKIKSTDVWRPGTMPFLRYEVTYDAAGHVIGKRRYD